MRESAHRLWTSKKMIIAIMMNKEVGRIFIVFLA